jgi:hypothetical protein
VESCTPVQSEPASDDPREVACVFAYGLIQQQAIGRRQAKKCGRSAMADLWRRSRNSKNVPQPVRPGFDEFLELERRDAGLVGVNRAAQCHPFRLIGPIMERAKKRLRIRESDRLRFDFTHVFVRSTWTTDNDHGVTMRRASPQENRRFGQLPGSTGSRRPASRDRRLVCRPRRRLEPGCG